MWKRALATCRQPSTWHDQESISKNRSYLLRLVDVASCSSSLTATIQCIVTFAGFSPFFFLIFNYFY